MKDEARPWHARDCEEVLEALETNRAGLGTEEARARLERYGPNRLPEQGKRGPLRRFLSQFHNVLIYVLIGAAGVTALMGHWVDTGVILAVVLINAFIGFIQEGKAESALEAIADMLSPEAVITRDGQRKTIPAEEIVPGDVVHLGSGDKVPADLRMMEARSLQIQEAALTGESLAVDKQTEPAESDASLGDRASMAYSGTLVTSGRGRGVVVATGAETEIGRISSMLSEVQQLTTPLLVQMQTFARWLTVAILAVSALAFVFATLVRDYEVTDAFMAAVGIAVAAIPEGLPAIMTITLAIGVSAMAARNAIVRRLPAVETLGAITTICSDKTGTLTRNELAVQRIVTAVGQFGVSGTGYAPEGRFTKDDAEIDPGEHTILMWAIDAGVVCNDSELRQEDGEWTLHGNPMDGALITLALKAGRERERVHEAFPRQDLIPFESSHKYMATLNEGEGGRHLIFLKGAPERVVELCSRAEGSEQNTLDPDDWLAKVHTLASEGYRTLGVAMREDSGDGDGRLTFESVEEGGFTLLGLIGLIDPSREEAIQAVADCRSAGIGVKMITGDHSATAQAVARELGLRGVDKALTGKDLDRLEESEWPDSAQEVDVYARTSPEHKLRLVEALQTRHEVVAMTGDGVNDAPALKRADIGIAMGKRGTEAAKEASEMVLADDNFATIALAVRSGRTVYDNLKKAILFMLPTNGGQAFTVMVAILFGTMLPVTPVQILWVNMVTTVTLALGLSFEQAEPSIMERPPRGRKEPILSRLLVWRIGFVSVLLVIATFGLFYRARGAGVDIETARAIAVNTLVAGQVVYLFSARVIDGPAWSPHALKTCKPALISVGIMLVLQGAFTYLPAMNFLFGTAPLGLEDWWPIILAAVAIFLAVESEKAIMRRFGKAR